MRELASKDAARGFSTAVNRAEFGRERIALTRRGKRVAAIVPLEDVEKLECLEKLDALPAKEPACPK